MTEKEKAPELVTPGPKRREERQLFPSSPAPKSNHVRLLKCVRASDVAAAMPVTWLPQPSPPAISPAYQPVWEAMVRIKAKRPEALFEINRGMKKE